MDSSCLRGLCAASPGGDTGDATGDVKDAGGIADAGDGGADLCEVVK